MSYFAHSPFLARSGFLLTFLFFDSVCAIWQQQLWIDGSNSSLQHFLPLLTQYMNNSKASNKIIHNILIMILCIINT
ncbi:hypothetical protein P8452_71482 [Trifolium repens]|nr:hypothetical protein P8452_71482 [Trifolium repens]